MKKFSKFYFKKGSLETLEIYKEIFI